MKYLKSYLALISEGISYNEDRDEFDFNWREDLPKDLINLKLQRYNRYLSLKKGTKLYYAYRFNKNIDRDIKQKLVAGIKYTDLTQINPHNLDLMLSKSINSFNQLEPLSTFDVIVFPKSSSSVLDLLKHKLSAKAGLNTLVASDLFIKNTIDNIQLDEEKLQSLSEENREKIISIINKILSKDNFKLRSVPPQYRKFITNFLSFNSEAERRIFNSIIDGKVLVVDDILTEGTTFSNMSKLLENFGANSIVGFILLG
jgi:alpha-N-acetylglucosamine transferase